MATSFPRIDLGAMQWDVCDWSQSGVEPPHSKVAIDRCSIVKEQSRLAGFDL
jgi:hypothetical protein